MDPAGAAGEPPGEVAGEEALGAVAAPPTAPPRVRARVATWTSRARTAWDARVEPLLRRATPAGEVVALVAIALGVASRVLALWTMDFRADGNTYTAMGRALAEHGSFLMPYGDVTTWAKSGPEPSHHYPPLYPAYLAVVYKAFGWGIWPSKLASLAVALAVIPVVFACSRDLYGPSKALLATGLVAAEPHLVWVSGTGFSENMVLLLFTVTMWAILKSLDRPPFIVIAGVAAGLAYLTRASVGYFFVVAGVGGFLWRFAYMRWRVFTNRWYVLAIGVFGAIFAAWALRNFLLFGWKTYHLGDYWVRLPNWQTSSYTEWVSSYAIANPDLWVRALRAKAALFAFYVAIYAAPFLPEAARSLRRIREEHTSALWLSVGLVTLIAWVITAMFWVYEQSDVYWWDNHRYVVIAYLPLAWALFRVARTDRGGFRLRYLLLVVGLLAFSAYVHVKPVQFPDIRAAEALDPLLRPGDEVAVHGNMIKYSFYAYLTRPDDVTVYGWSDGMADAPDWVVSYGWRDSFPGYSLHGTYDVTYRDVFHFEPYPHFEVRDGIVPAKLFRRTGA